MTAKQYLGQLKILDIKIKQRRREYNQLLSDAMCNASPTLKQDKVQTSISGDPMGDRLIKAADIEQEIDKLTRMLIAERHRIIGEIHMLNDARYIQILYLHYVEHKRLEDVADIMVKTNGESYSYDHIASLHGMALQDFEKIILKSHGNPK